MPEPTIKSKNLPPFLAPSSDASAYEKRGSRRWALGASFGYALSGLWYAVRTQLNMRIHLSVTVAVLVLGLYVKLDWVQWAVLILTIGAVLIAEMFNTVAEAALDATTPYYHPLIKIAKDVAAGAVLLTALLSVLVGLLILGPPLWLKLAAWTESVP
jgi:undecaprenol kinase/diacylglycerol kinase (ATP)